MNTAVPGLLESRGSEGTRGGIRGMASFFLIFFSSGSFFFFFSSYNLIFTLKIFQTHRKYSRHLRILVQTDPVVSGHTCPVSM